MIENLAGIMRTCKNNAARLIMTESAGISSMAHKAAYEELDVEWFRVLATLDKKTSAICRDMDGEIIRMTDYKTGVTAPPFHPWCRSTTVPHFDDNFGERAARGEDGKTHYVLNDMKYPEWKEKFARGGTKDDLIEIEGWRGFDSNIQYSKVDSVNRLKSEYGIDFSDSRKYPIDEQLMSDIVGWMDSFASDFPDFMQKNPVQIPLLNVMPPSQIGQNTYGYYMFGRNRPTVVEIALNGAQHSDMSAMDAMINRTTSNGWFVANANRKSVFVHEYGHHVSNSMRWISGNQNWQGEFLTSVINDFKAANPNVNINAGTHVSRYATRNNSELFAEAFAEYFGGENPRDFARMFGQKLETILKGVR
jgi:SPP1 gp7 family putative phage head morphogenesis protein